MQKYILAKIFFTVYKTWHFLKCVSHSHFHNEYHFFSIEPILSTVKSKLPFRSQKRKTQGSTRSTESYHQIAETDPSYNKADVEVADIMQDRSDSASTLVIGQDSKRMAENPV